MRPRRGRLPNTDILSVHDADGLAEVAGVAFAKSVLEEHLSTELTDYDTDADDLEALLVDRLVDFQEYVNDLLSAWKDQTR